MLTALAMLLATQVPMNAVRARANYEALASGRITIGQLTPIERAEVIELDRRLRRPALTSGVLDERCREQAAANAPAMTRLDRAIIELKCPRR